jgi:hypothetical protein
MHHMPKLTFRAPCRKDFAVIPIVLRVAEEGDSG